MFWDTLDLILRTINDRDVNKIIQKFSCHALSVLWIRAEIGRDILLMMSFLEMSQKKIWTKQIFTNNLNTLVMIGVLCVKQTGVVYRLN